MNKIKRLVIYPVKRYGTYFEHASSFQLPFVQIEEYEVIYGSLLVATFWISNYYEDSIELHTPIDINILNYILEQIKVRKFPKKKYLTK